MAIAIDERGRVRSQPVSGPTVFIGFDDMERHRREQVNLILVGKSNRYAVF